MIDDPFDRFANLHLNEFLQVAGFMAMMIERHGFCYARLQPGDSTSYEISIVSPPSNWQQGRYNFFAGLAGPMTFQQRFSGSYFVSTNFGRMYRWEGEEIGSWDYVYEKWTHRRGDTDAWTARILHRFLNTLAPLLPAKPERQEARID